MDFDIRSIQGLEDFEETAMIEYLSIVTSSKQAIKLKEETGRNYQLGSVFNSRTKEIIAGPDEPVKLCILKYFKSFVVWDDSTRIKHSFSKTAEAWSDGTPITNEDFAWIPNPKNPGKKMCKVTETENFMVCIANEVKKDKPQFMALSLGLTSINKREFAKHFFTVIKEAVKEHKPKILHNLIFSLTVEGVQEGDNAWYEWSKAICTGKTKDETIEKLQPLYEEVKNFNKDIYALTQQVKQVEAPKTNVAQIGKKQSNPAIVPEEVKKEAEKELKKASEEIIDIPNTAMTVEITDNPEF